MLELVDCGISMPKVIVGTIFIADIVGSPMGIIYLHYIHIIGINMYLVKEQHIINEKPRKKFIGILNIKQHITLQKITFIVKVISNSYNKIHTKLLTVWCNHKR